jgi:hypothetical protein
MGASERPAEQARLSRIQGPQAHGRWMTRLPACLSVELLGAPPPSLRIVATGGWRASFGVAGPGPAAGGTAAFRRRAAEECLDLAGLLREYRVPEPEEPWMAPERSEERLLAQVNAIVGLGTDAIDHVAALAIDPDVPDPGRVFGALFVLGCIAEDAWRNELRRIFETAVSRHPEEGAAAVEALCLSPRSDLAAIAKGWLRHERPALRAAAVRVLAFRWELAEEDWDLAAQDEHPSVVAASTAAPVHRYDPARVERGLQKALRSGLDPLVGSALRAGASMGLSALLHQVQHRAGDDARWADVMGAAQALYHRTSHPRDIALLIAGLQDPAGDRALRQDLYLELLAATHGRAPRFSPFDFVAAQRHALDRIATLSGAAAAMGSPAHRPPR